MATQFMLKTKYRLTLTVFTKYANKFDKLLKNVYAFK